MEASETGSNNELPDLPEDLEEEPLLDFGESMD